MLWRAGVGVGGGGAHCWESRTFDSRLHYHCTFINFQLTSDWLLKIRPKLYKIVHPLARCVSMVEAESGCNRHHYKGVL